MNAMISVKEDKDSRLWASKYKEADFYLKYGEDLGEIGYSHALFFPQVSDTSPCQDKTHG